MALLLLLMVAMEAKIHHRATIVILILRILLHQRGFEAIEEGRDQGLLLENLLKQKCSKTPYVPQNGLGFHNPLQKLLGSCNGTLLCRRSFGVLVFWTSTCNWKNYIIPSDFVDLDPDLFNPVVCFVLMYIINDVRPWSLSLLTSSFPWKVFRCTFWMRLWGGSSPKRTLVVSNSRAIHRLETGKLVRSLFPSEVQTAITYVDGRWCQAIPGV